MFNKWKKKRQKKKNRLCMSVVWYIIYLALIIHLEKKRKQINMEYREQPNLGGIRKKKKVYTKKERNAHAWFLIFSEYFYY